MNWTDVFNRYNRRKHKRFNLERSVQYGVTRLKKDIEGEGLLRNVSKHGFSMNLCDKIGKRAHIVVELLLNSNLRKSGVTLSGKVVWLKNYNDTAICGIKLDWISDKDVFDEYIKILGEASTIQ